MLKQRVLTAIVLLVVLALALTVAAPWGFPLFAGVFVVAGVWEWLRLTGLAQAPALALAAVVGVALLALSHSASATASGAGQGILVVAAALWCVMALRLVLLHRFFALDGHRVVHAVAGLVLVAACWIALDAAYARGIAWMVSVMALVWTADSAAYFAGRAFGRHKLAPAISPNKTWEGVAGGVLAVWIVGLVCAFVPALSGTFFAQVWRALPVPAALAVFTFLTGMSIVGDLFESHLKRAAGVKDSSRLLPGHGGVLDRIDALLPTLPLAALIGAWL